MTTQTLEQYCKTNGEKLTEPRVHTYDVIQKSDTPLSAYDILDQLGRTLDKPKPPTVYRALDFLQKHGFVHRIESINAYISCEADHRHNGAQFLICKKCKNAQEIHLCHMPDELMKRAQSNNFQTAEWVAEIHGICGSCGV